MSVGRPVGSRKLTWSEEAEMKERRDRLLRKVEVQKLGDTYRFRVRPQYAQAGETFESVCASIGVSTNTARAFLIMPKPRKTETELIELQVPKDLADTLGWEKANNYFADKFYVNKPLVVATLPRKYRIHVRRVHRLMLLLWKHWPENLGRRFPPEKWEKEHFVAIRQMSELKSGETGRISFPNMVILRSLMKALGKADLLLSPEFSTRKLKGVKGAYRDWYFTQDEVDLIVEFAGRQARVSEDKRSTYWLEFAAAFEFLIAGGARSGSVLGAKTLTVGHFQPDVGIITVYESKTDRLVPKILSDAVKRLLTVWVRIRRDQLNRAGKSDFREQNQQPMFPTSKALMTRFLNEAIQETHIDAKKGARGRPVSWHITRHTFATLMSNAGCPMEVSARLGGWEDLSTLFTYYQGISDEKAREWANKVWATGGKAK